MDIVQDLKDIFRDSWSSTKAVIKEKILNTPAMQKEISAVEKQRKWELLTKYVPYLIVIVVGLVAFKYRKRVA